MIYHSKGYFVNIQMEIHPEWDASVSFIHHSFMNRMKESITVYSCLTLLVNNMEALNVYLLQ